MIPKVEDAGQLHFVDHLLTQLEMQHKIDHRIGIEAQIENAQGTLNLREIATATDRIETIIFGPGDYAASIGVAQLVIGSIDPDYPGDQWHYVHLEDRDDGAGVRAPGDRRALHRHQERRRVPPAVPPGAAGRLRREVGAPPAPGRRRKRGLHADAGTVRRGPPAARRLPPRDARRAQGRRDARGPDDRRGVAEDRRGASWPGARRPGWQARRRHEPRARPAHRRAARDRRPRAPVRRRAHHPRRVRARARGRVPRRHRRGPEGARHLRVHDPGGVRRARARPDHLRARRVRALARVDERVGDREHPLHRRRHADARRHRGAAGAVPAEDGDRARSAARSR